MPTTRPAPPRPIAALVVACALAVSGCGGDDEQTASTSTASGASTTATSAGGTTASGASGGASTTGGAASGGGQRSGPGDEATYVQTLESVCKKVAAESRTFIADVTKAGSGGNADDAFENVKGPMTRFFDAVDQRYQELARAQAPAKWASYQASLRSDAAGVSKYLDEAKDLLEDADSPEDLQKLQALMGRTTFNTGDAPKDLAAKTPSCTPAGAAASGSGSSTTATTPRP